MKRFFMYCVVIIGAVFVGLAFYMFAKNNETINLTIPEGETIYLNVGEAYDLPIDHQKKDKRTTIETTSDNDGVALFNTENGKIIAKAGGTATITITPSNDDFGPFRFSIRVGDGSQDNPYFITKTEQLLKIGAADSLWTLDASYEVVEHLDFNELSEENRAWTPIGTADKQFTGVFNGGTKIISNLTIDESCTAEYVGLFGYVEKGAKVERVTLANPQIKTAAKYVGAIAGHSEGVITRCRVENANIEATNQEAFVGGVVGQIERVSNETEVVMNQVDGGVIKGKNYVGGLIGSVTSGVVANNKVNIQIAAVDQDGVKKAGGVVGKVDAKAFTQVINAVSKTFMYNSLVQTNLILTTYADNVAVENIDLVAADDTLTGDAETDYVGNIYYSQNATLQTNRARNLSRSDLELQANYTYKNTINQDVEWDFAGTWSLESKAEGASIGAYIIQDGAGETVKPLRNGAELTSENAKNLLEQLVLAGTSEANSHLLGYNYVITEDIVINAQESEILKNWTPIGNSQRPFSGAIYGVDGKTLTIKNIKIPTANIKEYSSEKTAGVFGTVAQGAIISNVEVQNIIIYSDHATYVGGLVGKNNGSVLDSKVYGVYIDNGATVGGLVGANSGTISSVEVGNSLDPENFADIPVGKTEQVLYETEIKTSGTNEKAVGGLVGRNTGVVALGRAEIIITVTADKAARVGGLVGYNAQNAILKLSSKNGGKTTVGGTLDKYVGGLVGDNAGKIERSYSAQSSVVGPMHSTAFVGGIAGMTGGENSRIFQSYFDGSLSGFKIGGIVANLNGLVEECYSKAAIESGSKIGGLAYKITSTIKNSYFYSSSTIKFSEGTQDNEYAGLVVEFPEGAVISRCLTSAITGASSDGEVYPETKDFTRSNILNFFTGSKYGTFDYAIVNTQGMEDGAVSKQEWLSKIFGSVGWGKDNKPKRFNYITFDGSNNLGDQVIAQLTGWQFDESIWNFSGPIPTLNNLNLEDEIAEEFDAQIIVSLAETSATNVVFDSSTNTVTVSDFTAEQTIKLTIYVENSFDPISVELKEGDCVTVEPLVGETLQIKISKEGTARIEATAGIASATITINVNASTGA